MHRTQVYLTDAEKAALNTLMAQTNKSMAYFIREALDQYLTHQNNTSFSKILSQSQNILTEFNSENIDRDEWKERDSRLK